MPSWIVERTPLGFTGILGMLFLVVLRMFPEKFSFGISFAPLEPNALRLHTDTHTRIHPHTSKNSSDFGHYKIKIQFQKYFFRHCIQCKKIKLTMPKIGGRAPRPLPLLDSPVEFTWLGGSAGWIIRLVNSRELRPRLLQLPAYRAAVVKLEVQVCCRDH